MAGGPIHLEIRLRRTGTYAQPTRTAIRAALIYIADTGTVPDGWEVAAIDWRHPRRSHGSGGTWRSGDVKDLQSFAALLIDQSRNARIGLQKVSR